MNVGLRQRADRRRDTTTEVLTCQSAESRGEQVDETVAKALAAVGWSERHLAQRFRTEIGLTPETARG